jgi:hypothetical protein
MQNFSPVRLQGVVWCCAIAQLRFLGPQINDLGEAMPIPRLLFARLLGVSKTAENWRIRRFLF